jgi:uncharacterized coiled-coil protein SlyX
MIKFFRKIRQNLLSEGSTGKYLKYAIGEIVLVVIGIFIALQLNIWNENRKMEQEIITVLTEVQKDLGTNIQQSEYLFDYYERRDSIISLALHDQLNKSNYRGDNNYEYLYVAMNAHHLKIHDKGFRSLTERLDDVPKRYKELLEPLNEIYTYNKYEIDKFDARLDKITDRLMDDQASKQDWYYKLNQGEISATAIDYYLHDPLYKNALYLYSNAAANLTRHVEWFDYNAVHSYKQIRKLTGHPEKLPEFIPQNQITVTKEMYKALVGNYRLVSVKRNGGTTSVLDDLYTMKVKEDGLELVGEDGTVYPLYFLNESMLYFTGAEVSIEKDSGNHLSGLIYRDSFYETKFRKVD